VATRVDPLGDLLALDEFRDGDGSIVEPGYRRRDWRPHVVCPRARDQHGRVERPVDRPEHRGPTRQKATTLPVVERVGLPIGRIDQRRHEQRRFGGVRRDMSRLLGGSGERVVLMRGEAARDAYPVKKAPAGRQPRHRRCRSTAAGVDPERRTVRQQQMVEDERLYCGNPAAAVDIEERDPLSECWEEVWPALAVCSGGVIPVGPGDGVPVGPPCGDSGVAHHTPSCPIRRTCPSEYTSARAVRQARPRLWSPVGDSLTSGRPRRAASTSVSGGGVCAGMRDRTAESDKPLLGGQTVRVQNHGNDHERHAERSYPPQTVSQTVVDGCSNTRMSTLPNIQ
jgi:hypothetical protein